MVKKTLGPVVKSFIVHSVTVEVVPLRPAPPKRFYSTKRTFMIVVLLLMAISFTGGMGVVLELSRQSVADDVLDKVAPTPPDSPGITVIPDEINKIADFPIYILPAYQAPAAATPDEFVLRKAKLKSYLQTRHSPFAKDDDALGAFVHSPHMKLMLAISFAESTLGQKCYYNNCSGIGGSKIVAYPNTKAWVEAFSRLLERRYKNQTLRQMCGVYVQPCNPNWLVATNQILRELKAHGVE